MTDMELLQEVKTRLGITGTFQNSTVLGYINDTKAFMLDAGVTEDVCNGSAAVGVIARGVSDLWNYGSAQFSEYFYQRVIQLKMR